MYKTSEDKQRALVIGYMNARVRDWELKDVTGEFRVPGGSEMERDSSSYE